MGRYLKFLSESMVDRVVEKAIEGWNKNNPEISYDGECVKFEPESKNVVIEFLKSKNIKIGDSGSDYVKIIQELDEALFTFKKSVLPWWNVEYKDAKNKPGVKAVQAKDQRKAQEIVGYAIEGGKVTKVSKGSAPVQQ